MNADVKAMVYAWLDLLVDFLRFFKWEPYDKIADEIEDFISKDAE